MIYNYTTLKEGEHQYDAYDFNYENTVSAVYIKSPIEVDNGNPFIEALPAPRTLEDVYRDYNKGIIGYNYKKQIELSKYDKLSAITQLKHVRYMLPFHECLEEEFAMALRSSYRDRRRQINTTGDIKIVCQNETKKVSSRLLGKNGASTNAGITLLGYSGCGKSASLEIMLSNYPQIIEHQDANRMRFSQIVYLVIVCPANSNFNALYNSIGAELDKVLGNVEPVYEKMISKCRTIGDKANMICKLVEIFSIGCLIFDEIQLLDFEGQKESTFEGLLTIVNKTKVAIMAVGTEDAYKKMFPNLRMSRRTGAHLNASEYCDDKQYFSAIATNIMEYQWWDTYIPPNSDMIKALYDVSKGIIGILVSVYMYMQIEYLRSDRKPEINVEFVYKVYNKYFSGLKKMLNDINCSTNDIARQKIIEEANNSLELLLQQEKIAESKSVFVKNINSDIDKNKNNIKQNAIINIENTIKYTGEIFNRARIEKAVAHIMSLNKNNHADEKTISIEAYKWLKKNASDKRVVSKKRAVMDEDHIKMKNMLLNEE